MERKQMDRQTIFDTVVRHLGQQGAPAVDEFHNCVYRAPDGKKCAVGCLIPDELYQRGMDHNRDGGGSYCVHGLAEDFEVPGYFRVNLELLQRLQSAHDAWALFTLDQVLGKLHLIASDYNLNPAVIAEAFPAKVEA